MYITLEVYATNSIILMIIVAYQQRSQNAEKITHIKGRLLDQAMILQLRPFSNGNFSQKKEFAPRGSKFFPLWAAPYSMDNHLPPLNVTLFITHVRNLCNGFYANAYV